MICSIGFSPRSIHLLCLLLPPPLPPLPRRAPPDSTLAMRRLSDRKRRELRLSSRHASGRASQLPPRHTSGHMSQSPCANRTKGQTQNGAASETPQTPHLTLQKTPTTRTRSTRSRLYLTAGLHDEATTTLWPGKATQPITTAGSQKQTSSQQARSPYANTMSVISSSNSLIDI